ncbi:peptidase M24 [Desulfolithobacter dissulfuricans]|uniref:Peptidase M24 n=1 Tax=Desulfolithobacter dissulfuricans TaxID=2795293 RepID=A0A915XJU9_9BACT|nr:M23 family metallopeptidase [Desulfolithobacter dissulfuricans]BCO09117.1 peptidase M24 [Desulfolithobacter dissulfuricans]
MARHNRLRKSRRSGGLGRKILFFLLIILICGLAVGGLILFENEEPSIAIDTDIQYLGSNATLPWHARDGKSGISSIVISIVQDGKSAVLLEKKFSRQAWFSQAGPASESGTFSFDARKAGIKDGKAELVLQVRDFSLNKTFQGNSGEQRLEVVVDTRAPRVTVAHAQRYIRPGGSGIVVYDLSEETVRHGVLIDDNFFPGYPLPIRENRYIAYIALPWNAGPPQKTEVIAEDKAGNRGKAVFSMIYKKVREKKDRINVSDGFLKRKIPEFEAHYPEMSGSEVEKYLFANNEIRQRNAEAIRELCANPVPEQLWKDRFLRMPGAGRAGFADQRTYYYKNKAIDHQVHLGMDIASTARVPIKAANNGKVIYTDYLGIYGNTVIIDHGQGLFSLYSHLSRIDTETGTLVKKGDLIGHSGATGMAGGDHLHFSMLIHGIFVTPVEWWDQHWIDVNINAVLSDSQL